MEGSVSIASWKPGGTGKPCRMQLESCCPLATTVVVTWLSGHLINMCSHVRDSAAFCFYLFGSCNFLVKFPYVSHVQSHQEPEFDWFSESPLRWGGLLYIPDLLL